MTQDILADSNHRTAPRDPALDELAELRKQRERLETELAERTAPPVSTQIEIERRKLVDAEGLRAVLDAGEVVDKTIRVVQTPGGMVIVKKCSAMRYRKFQDAGDFDSEATERLCRPNVIYPELPVFDRMLEEHPMIIFTVGNAMAWLAGIRKEQIEKK